MTTVRLREWRGVKPVTGPSGLGITAQLRTSGPDERVLEVVAAHLGRLWRADLALVSLPQLLDEGVIGELRRQARRDRHMVVCIGCIAQ
jgi:hypothetical protein